MTAQEKERDKLLMKLKTLRKQKVDHLNGEIVALTEEVSHLIMDAPLSFFNIISSLNLCVFFF